MQEQPKKSSMPPGSISEEPPPIPQGDIPKYVFWVQGIFGMQSQKPLVLVTVNGADFSTTMSTSEARDLALNLLESAEAAEQDAFTIAFLKSRDIPDQGIARFLEEMREWRTRIST